MAYEQMFFPPVFLGPTLSTIRCEAYFSETCKNFFYGAKKNHENILVMLPGDL